MAASFIKDIRMDVFSAINTGKSLDNFFTFIICDSSKPDEQKISGFFIVLYASTLFSTSSLVAKSIIKSKSLLG